MSVLSELPYLQGLALENRSIAVGSLRMSAIVAGQGPWVVCLHGFPDNNLSFRHQIPALVSGGYRVVCPLLPGYEPSSQWISGRYDMDRVSDCLLAFLYELQREDRTGHKLHLIGHDWGAISGFAAVVKEPALFATFTSLTIPYNLTLARVLRYAPGYLPYSWYIQLFQVPGLAETLLKRNGGALADSLIRCWSPDWHMPAEVRASIKQGLLQPGVKEAALDYYRSIYALGDRGKKARQLLNARVEVPTLFIRGRKDGCIAESLWRLIRPESFSHGWRLEAVEAGHFPHQEKPQEVNRLLLEWLGA